MKKEKERSDLFDFLLDVEFQESRETRVNSWKSFQKTTKTKDSAKGKTPNLFKPPAYKPEGR